MKVFHCDRCGQLLFFEDARCPRCARVVGYVPELAEMSSLEDLGDGRVRSSRSREPLRRCDNGVQHRVCNWTRPADEADPLCRACRLTRTIPDLSREGNLRLWAKLEAAKRRLVYTLERLGLPLRSKVDDDGGLAFDFLEDMPGTPVLTGHAGGVVTVNLAEADDAERVKRRVALNEPYRTLLGHLRHESGHHYWERLVRPDEARLAAFRALFGDEREDYQAALARHYERPREDWGDEYVSAYATMHPWEDWAETWAHYLHVTDALETASECGVQIRPAARSEPRLSTVPNPVDDAEVPFDRMMRGFCAITYVMNSLSRGLGNDDAYPFVLSGGAIEKLRFVHETIAAR